MSFSKYQFSFLFLLIILASIFGNCAKVSSPPGGPVDKTPPVIVSTIPSNNAVNVISDNKIIVVYTEKIDNKSIAGAIYISPRPSGEIKYKWRNKSLDIIFPDSFSDSTTYVVNLGAAIRDLHGNKMENSYTFAFSTDTVIDKGFISGTIVKGDKPVSGVSIGLFITNEPDLIMFDSLYPPYLTQTGEEGEYKLDFLPDGEYFILAFEDKNKNQLFDYPDESFGIPDRLVVVSNGLAPEIFSSLIKEDSTSVAIISTTFTEDHLIRVKLSKAVASEIILNNLEKIYLLPSDDSLAAINPVAVKEQPGVSLSTFSFYFTSIPEGRYNLKISNSIFNYRLADSLYSESGQFNIKPDPDNMPPEIISVSLDRKKVMTCDSIILIHFSEPVAFLEDTGTAVSVSDSYNNLYNITYSWVNAFRLNVLINNLVWSQDYSVSINETAFADLSGNLLGDSTVVYGFSTYEKDSLGEATGTISYNQALDTSGVSYLEFRSLSDKSIFSKSVFDNEFYFQLPAGNYFLSGFIDRDSNGRHDLGSLSPFRFSETSIQYSDTIRVRSRFETTGIEFVFQ